MKEVSDGAKIRPYSWNKVVAEFYEGNDVLSIARELLGHKLVSFMNGSLTSGIITETEAYAGETDRASHAFGGRRTRRTETMYQKGGLAYIYLCYGMHSLFNVVTNIPGIPHAVLVRGIYPLGGISIMENRIQRKINILKDGSGPGKVTRLLGVDCRYNGMDLSFSNSIWIEKSDFSFPGTIIETTRRIGVEYAGEDAFLPYRYVVKPSNAGNDIKKAGLV